MESPRLARLSPEEKRALLARLLQRKLGKAPVAAPLSAGQRALWFLHRLDPESAAYNLHFCAAIRSRLDVDAFRRALQGIIDRHACLRSTFVDRPDGPVQLVFESAEPALDVVDAAEWSDEKLQAELLAEAHRPFSLEKGPVFRTRLFMRGESDPVCLLTVHHIVSDFWTLGVLMEDLGAIYPAVIADADAGLPPPSGEYADFVRWQADLLAGAEGQQLWEYWRGALGGELPTLNLPTDRLRPAVQTDRGSTYRFRIDAALTGHVRELARSEGATLFAVLLAGYQSLLHRLTGQDDVLVGSPVAGRSRPEFAGLVGYFVNMIVLRAQLCDRPTFRQFLAQVRQTALDGLRHGDFPFAQLVERLQPERDLSRHALFQAAFVLKRGHSADRVGTNGHVKELKLGGLIAEPRELDHLAVPFDCNLMVEETGDELNCALEYNTDLFDEATIARWMECFRILLESTVADPDCFVDALTIVSPADRSTVLKMSQGPSIERPAQLLHRLIEDQVDRTPDQSALRFAKSALTYRELNERANRLARHLQTLGAGRDVPVALCLDRSFDLVVGLLAVLKAGSCYVPLDSDLPSERLAFLLGDLRPAAVLTQSHLADRLPPASASVIRLDADSSQWADADPHNLAIDSSPESLAYIIYTSGSTGQPKGCANTHRGIVNRLLWMQETYALTTADRVFQKTPYSFDVSVWEFFWPLMTGAELVIAEPEGHRDPDYLARTIAAERISVLHFVPSMLQAFLHAKNLDDCATIRDVICSGEALSWELQGRFFEQFPRVRLQNLYGPTEAAVDVTAWECNPADARRIVPIGRPIANTQVLILDRELQPTPVGVPGEIHLGGVQLARGYWNRPELTSERFIAHPTLAGERLYKTGDLGRFLDDGSIQYLGRLDHQVKIRGFRIELGEIEAALSQSALVRECVAVARTENGTARLVAYIVPRDGQLTSSTSELRAFLADKLPEFMIPAQFVTLTELPLLSNGKIDRSALPAPDEARPELATAYVAPRTPTESRLAQIWGDVLRLERVGAHDRFFELGGHSLLATQVVTRVRAEFGVELPLRRFFESPSLADLAGAIDEHSGPAPAANMSMAALRPAPRDRALPMSFGQETLWFLDQLVPGNTTYNVPAAVRIAGPLDFEALRKSFEVIVHRHESLRSTFALEDDRRVIAIRDPEPLALEIVDLRDLPASEREARAKELTETEARKSFNLATGPLLRLSVLRLGELDQIVLMTVHHIAFDGWSTGVLISEFAALYRGFISGSQATLPTLPIQFPDLAYWQKQWFSEGLLDNQLDYWKQQLKGIPPLLALPTDRPRPQVWGFRGAAHNLHFPPSLVAEIRALGKREGCTLFMTLLAAFQTLLHRYSGMDDICVGSPIANRNRAEIEGLIGFVVNTLVLRGDLSGNPTFAELLRRTREAAFGAYSHQDLPFEQVMRAITPNRDARHSSLFQVLFVLQNAPVHIPPLPNLTPRLLLDSHNGTSKFDLTLGLTEMPEGLIGILEYNCDLFDASTIERMALHFRRLLEAVVVDSHRTLSDLPLLTDDDQSRALAAGEGDRVNEVLGCFHRRFEAQVAINPSAEALVWGSERLTYDQLNRRANQLAHELRSRGVRPDSIVGLYFERSTEMIVAVLAVLKAGGGYLPLDPALPRERLGVILDDAKPVLVLTQQRLANEIPFDAGRVLQLDTDVQRWSHQSSENLFGGAGPQNIAYVIYTSGSTGTPKGCVIEQGSLDNGFLGWQAAYRLENFRAYLQMANFAFDVFTADLVRALGSGGKLVLCPSETLLEPETLIELIRREEIHYAEFVPAVMRPLLRHLEATNGNLAPVTIVVVGADVWYGGEYRRLRRALGPNVRVLNSYGLTEATIDNLYYDGSDEGLHDEGPIPIGRPYANQRACVLDSRGRVQPVGVPGELHVGGAALARGYLNRPELTAEKFIPDPFHPGERLYKTGDLARLLPSGQMELLGRTDHQVKIRGFRIELGEIESILMQFPAVHDAVVVARDDDRSIKRLLAYVVIKDGAATPSASDLRAYLGSKLPEYMVPSAFMTIDALPLSPNGKVDRNALPAPEAGRSELATQYVAPVSPSETKLAELWGEVLRVDRVGLRDSFFELGGHSLLATQVLARVRAEFEVELPLRKLFEAPVLADFASVIDAAERAKHGPALVHLSDQVSAPLSYAQQRLWFLDRLEPGNPVYHVATAARLTGTLNRAIWEQCFLEVGARHDILRTAFPATDGQPEAAVAPSVALNVNDIDLSHLPADQRESRARQEALREYSRPFDLARGPLFRIALLKLGAQEHILLLTMHHIIADGGSLGVFLRDLVELYARHSAGQAGSLPPLPIQYADFARWQQEWLAGGERDRQMAYWRERLTDAPASLDLPTDRSRPPIQSSAGAIEVRALPARLADAIRAVSNAEGVTPYMTLLAGFEAILHRYTGQDDLLIGTPVSNRSRVEIEGLIGCFVNTLVLRSDLSGSPSFRTLLARTRENVMQALAHQELPFEALVESVQTRRDPSRTPLFQVMFAWQSAPTAVQLPSLSLKTIPIDHGTAMFDLTIIVTDDEGQITVSAEYNTDLYNRDTIARLLRHYETLLEQVTANPETTATATRLLGDEERQKLLVEWNATDLDYPRDKTVLSRIADWASKTPDAIAVEDGAGLRLTYGELDKRSARLAARLTAAGVKRGDFVGLGFERSLEMAVGLLGILKAGGAYVPLDPQLPAERLRFVLDDAGVRTIVTPASLRNFVPDWKGATILVNDEQSGTRTAIPELPRPDDPAYVIYTSGSTGTPKGVVVSHQNLHNLCAGTIDRWGLNSRDRVLQFTSLSFDVAVEEIFPAWVSGATVVLRPSGPIAGAVEFLHFVDERRISMIELPSSYWHELTAELEAEPRALPESLRMVVVGGEAARLDAAIAWRRLAGSSRRWINAYGPTETTVTSVAYEPTAYDVLPSGSVPIGRPIANTRVYVLDRSGELAPIGLPGELVIGGEGVTRGYLNAPELTAARFVPDRFRGQGQMYRTGDRVRWRPDGQIEFLGRFDVQVKVRGFRVEPGEIETALGQHPAVRAAAVVAQPDASGQLQLVAYVTLNDDSSADADALVAHLRGRVPTYLLPAAIAVLPELPRTTSGKIDRRALLASGAAGVVSARAYVTPRTPTEETIAATWADLFGAEKIGAEDNFFDLGGHSLMAVQLAARMSRTLGRQIPVRAVILYPTVAALAQAFDDGFIGDESADELGAVASGGAALLDNLGPHVSIERRSIEDLIVNGEIAPVQSAAIGYLPSSLLPFAGLKAEDVTHGWLGNRPIVSGIFDWDLGRIATILIPRFDSQLYDEQQDTVAAITDALRVAKRLGASTVSLTGLLPSATNYGRAVEKAIGGQDVPRITTGHATTTAAVVLAVRRILSEARRDLARERVAFIGLGSIGSTVLRLLLRSTPHPAELILCDVFAKHEALRELEQEIRGSGFKGPIRVCEAQGAVPPDVYSATLIVGATNAADILDVDRLRPGTLIVDDSAPHLFRPDHAMRRLHHRGDILFTEGGTLWARETIRQIVHLPAEIEPLARLLPQDVLPVHDPRQITGCIVSSLLSTRDSNLKPTVGLVDADLAAKHLDALNDLNFTAAQLHCEGFALDADTIAKFRDRFGESPVGRSQPTTAAAQKFDWQAEAVLDPVISAEGLPPVRSGEPRTILLTGATGFLGAFLLGDLLELTSARIVCLVRAGNESDALKRIRRNLTQYLIEAGENASRIIPLAGDLAEPRLGLSEQQFARLAQDVDVIYHNGAQVHFLHPYSTLKPANVLGTESVLRFATTARLKPAHFVSTLSVLSGLSKGRLAAETDRNETPEWLENGYAQSKWVAERLVWSAMDRGIPATILRPGRIVWHSRTGALNQDDVFTRALRACIQIAAVPALDSVLEMTPVDYISRAIIAIARNPEAPGRAYHLFNRQYVRLQDLLNWVREAGYPLEVLPPDQWLARVQSSATHDAQDALAGLLPLLANGVPFLGDDANSGPLPGPNFDGRNTQAILAGTGVESPAIGPETVAVYLARLVADGLLNPANKHKKPAAASTANGQSRRRGNRSRSHGTK